MQSEFIGITIVLFSFTTNSNLPTLICPLDVGLSGWLGTQIIVYDESGSVCSKFVCALTHRWEFIKPLFSTYLSFSSFSVLISMCLWTTDTFGENLFLRHKKPSLIILILDSKFLYTFCSISFNCLASSFVVFLNFVPAKNSRRILIFYFYLHVNTEKN